jgi:hypothetical protein
VFVVDESLSVGKCKEEYDELLKVDWFFDWFFERLGVLFKYEHY